MNLELNPKQKEAAEAPGRPLLIVAGAGTGKTRTLVARLRHLIDRGVPPETICAITFTNKAAREMAERAGDCGRRPPFIGTFHSLGARILRAEAKSFRRTPGFVIFDDHDSLALVKKIIKTARTAEGEAKKEGAAFFADNITRIKNGMLQTDDTTVSGVLRRYEAELQKHNAFDFDDLIQKVVLLFKSKPATLAKYQKRFRHILVDEYQDLNNIQYELVRLLAGESRQISVVGDDQQTIYSWRGSNFEIFLNFERDWPESAVVVLDENYRSSQNIIAAASAVIKNNLRQKPKDLWTRNAPGEPVKLVEVADEEEEAEWIGEKISNFQFPISKNRGGGNSESGTVAVLYRTNAQSRAIEQSLIQRNIPYRVFGGIKFYERREIRDVLAGIRYLVNSGDELSRERLEKTFGKRGFANFAPASASAASSAEAAAKAESADRSETEPVKLIQAFLERSDYFEYLKKNFVNHAERKENIAELLYFAARFSSEGGSAVGGKDATAAFLEEVALLQATDSLANSKEQMANGGREINLMTIHLAKGLEFDRVFVAGCAEGILPHARSMASPGELEEERRLMYVAMTRARKELCLSFYDLPSRFLSEIPEELVQFESPDSRTTVFSDGEERYITLD